MRPYGRIIGLTESDQVPEDAGQFVGHGGDGFGRAESSFPAAKAISEVVFAVPEALGGQAQRLRDPHFLHQLPRSTAAGQNSQA